MDESDQLLIAVNCRWGLVSVGAIVGNLTYPILATSTDENHPAPGSTQKYHRHNSITPTLLQGGVVNALVCIISAAQSYYKSVKLVF